MKEVVAHEIIAGQNDHHLCSYDQIKQSDGSRQEFMVVETPMGNVERLVSEDGHPLGSEKLHREDARLHELLSDPDGFRKHSKKEREDAEEAKQLLEMLPAAFQYRYAGREDGLTKLNFTPDPSFKPEHREGSVFHHMQGVVWVDQSQRRIAGIEGKLMSEVKFGGGILGYLAQGGTFVFKRRDVGQGHWETTRLDVNMDGKALFFKTISVHQHEEDTGFRQVGKDIDLQFAAKLLQTRIPAGR